MTYSAVQTSPLQQLVKRAVCLSPGGGCSFLGRAEGDTAITFGDQLTVWCRTARLRLAPPRRIPSKKPTVVTRCRDASRWQRGGRMTESVAVSFEFFPPHDDKMETVLWKSINSPGRPAAEICIGHLRCRRVDSGANTQCGFGELSRKRT